MKKQWKKAVSIGCAACMLASTMPVAGFNLVAEAQGIETQSNEAATSGTWGTCEWNLDEDGVLTISGGVAESLRYKDVPWIDIREDIEKVNITGNITFGGDNISLYELFEDCNNVTQIEGLEKFDTSKVTNMSYMFYNCKSLKKLDVSGFDTSKVTDMHNMFSYCSNLKELDVSGFDTSKVTDMNGMFNGCRALTELDIRNFDTSKVTDMNWMFNGCRALTELDIRNFDTSQVTNMEKMFYRCSKLTKLDLRNFDTSNVTTMREMFDRCTDLEKLDISCFNTENVESMSWMFSRCNSLKKLNLGNFYLSDGVYISHMFFRDNLTDITVPKVFDENSNFYQVLEEGMALGQWKDKTENTTYSYRPDGLTEKHEYLLEKKVSVSGTWGECEWILKDGILTINGGTAKSINAFPFVSDEVLLRPIDVQKIEIKGKIVFDEEEVSLENLFSGCSKLTKIEGLDKIDMSKVVNINYIFSSCSSLKKLDMGNWDLVKIQKCEYMVSGCKFDFIVMPSVFENEEIWRHFEIQLLIGYAVAGDGEDDGLSLSEGAWCDTTTGTDYDDRPDELKKGHTYINKTLYLAQREDTATGITIKKEDGSLFDSDIELNVSNVTTNENYANYADIANKLGNTNLLYDIALEKDAEAIQPDGKILVSIPLPDNMSEEAKVYCITEDGMATDMNAVFADGFLTFSTDHFSVYAVAEDKEVIGDVNGDGIFNMADAALVRRYVANLNVTIDISAADVNKDGKIDMVDYALMRRALANWDVELK